MEVLPSGNVWLKRSGMELPQPIQAPVKATSKMQPGLGKFLPEELKKRVSSESKMPDHGELRDMTIVFIGLPKPDVDDQHSITALMSSMQVPVQYSTVQYSTVQYSTVQYSTVQYSTVQYSTVQYSTVQYSTVQYHYHYHYQYQYQHQHQHQYQYQYSR